MTSRAWVDDADKDIKKELPTVLKRSHTLPRWATTSNTTNDVETGDAVFSEPLIGQKRFRNEELDAILARTEPLLTSKYDRQHAVLPPVLSVLPLPRDTAQTVQWHRNGQMAVVGGNHHLYLFHAAGKFVEQLSKTDVVRRVVQTQLGSTGEDVLVVGHESYTPDLLVLATQKIMSLKFLCTRDSSAYRNGRRDNGKHDFYITKAAVQENDLSGKTVGIASGATVTIGSLSSGSVTHKIDMNDPVVDLAFSGVPYELTIATHNKLRVYDLRRSVEFLRETSDNGTVGVTTFATTDSAFAVGSSSGIVNVYKKGTVKPVKTLKNLTTSINHVVFGGRSNSEKVLAFSTKSQKGGFRLAVLPECRVVPSFPAVSQRHYFIQCLTIAPTIPVLSVGEKQRVTNYAL